jgi:hypothetical protein
MLVGGFDVSWMSVPCQDLCGNPYCYLSEITGSLQCNSPVDQCITTLGFHVGCDGGKNNFTLFQQFKASWSWNFIENIKRNRAK